MSLNLLCRSVSKNTQKYRNALSLTNQTRSKYSEKLVNRFKNPQNVGSLDKKSERVGTGIVGAPACGDVMQIQVEVGEDGRITDAKFKTFGCGSAIASSSYVAELVKGKTPEECLTIKNKDIASHLSLPPVKLHCSMLAEDAIKAAVYDYYTKQKVGNEKTEQKM